MKVFLSWSGDRSKAVACVLRDFLPRILQALKPWMSSVDINSGQRWQDEIGQYLNDCDIGICVITSDNVNRPWLNFEVGAISKSVKHGRPIPLLFDVESSELQGPISQFQGRLANEHGLLALIEDLNVLFPEDQRLSSETLKDTFGRFWTDINHELEEVLNSSAPEEKPAREMQDMVKEVLRLVRELHSFREVLPGISSLGMPVTHRSPGMRYVLGGQSVEYTSPIFGDGLIFEPKESANEAPAECGKHENEDDE